MKEFLSERVCVLRGDITKQDVDVIVNAANSTLLGAEGWMVQFTPEAVPKFGKPREEVRRARFPKGLPTGEAVITTGGRLLARWAIHTVGPICRPGREPDGAMLASGHRNSLTLAAEKELRSIAFPAISTGAIPLNELHLLWRNRWSLCWFKRQA